MDISLSQPYTENSNTGNLTGRILYSDRSTQANKLSAKCYCVIPSIRKTSSAPSQWPPHPQYLSLRSLIRWQKREIGMKHTAATLGLGFVFIHCHLESCRCSRSIFCSIMVHATGHCAWRQISTFTSRFLGFGLVIRDFLSYLYSVPHS